MADVVLYKADDGEVKLDVNLVGETVWLSMQQITELFGKSKSTISEHITKLFKNNELSRDSVVRNFRTTASDGKS